MQKRLLACLAAAVTFVAPALPQDVDTLAPDAFQRVFYSFLEAEFDQPLCFRALDAASFRFGRDGEHCDNVVHLATAYEQYLTAPDRIDPLLTGISRTVATTFSAEPGITSDFRDALIVQLRPTRYFASASDEDIVSHPFAGDLSAVLMLDGETTLKTVSREMLAEAKLNDADAFRLAKDNLRRRMGPVYSEELQRVTLLESGTALITGALALPETCSAGAPEAVYFVFDPNGLMKADLTNPVGVSNLLGIAGQMMSDGTTLSQTVIQCSNGEWTQRATTEQVSVRAG